MSIESSEDPLKPVEREKPAPVPAPSGLFQREQP